VQSLYFCIVVTLKVADIESAPAGKGKRAKHAAARQFPTSRGVAPEETRGLFHFSGDTQYHPMPSNES